MLKLKCLFSGSSPGQDARLTQWALTTFYRSSASTTPGLRSPSGCRGVWWTHWTRCCLCWSRSWAPPCRTRRTRRAATRRSIEEPLLLTSANKLWLKGFAPMLEPVYCEQSSRYLHYLTALMVKPASCILWTYWNSLKVSLKALPIFHEKWILKPLPFLCFPWNTW